jgi:hypothetical protein
MLTTLDSGAGQVQALLLKTGNAEVAKTLENFTSGRELYVFTTWFMDAAPDPESAKLMELH